jgi:hypothetical protein
MDVHEAFGARQSIVFVPYGVNPGGGKSTAPQARTRRGSRREHRAMQAA